MVQVINFNNLSNTLLVLVSTMSVASAVVMGVRSANNKLKSERIEILEGLVKDQKTKIEELSRAMEVQQQEIDQLKRENAGMVGYTALKVIMDESAKHFDTRIDGLMSAVASISSSPTVVVADGKTR